MSDAERILSPALAARLTRFRLVARRRVQGRFAGAHASTRYGTSLDFADHREYVPGDDPRRLDLAVYQRLGRLLVKLYEAEDEAAISVVLDLSASMGFGSKIATARTVTAAFAALASAGQDRIRVLLASAGRPDGDGSDGIDAGPWFRGASTLPAVEHRLRHAAPDGGEETAAGRPDLLAALRRAHGEGPRGPVVLVSDLLTDDWRPVLRALAAGRGDAVLVHLLGRDDVDPAVDGDVRLVDAETGDEVAVGNLAEVLDRFVATRDAWLDAVEAATGRHGIAYARLVDDENVETLLLATLRRLGVVA